MTSDTLQESLVAGAAFHSFKSIRGLGWDDVGFDEKS